MILNNFQELEKHLTKLINEVLMDDVAETAKDALDTAIDRVVYNRYVPEVYDRRYDNGGLSDRRLMIAIPIENGITMQTIANVNTEYGSKNSGRLDEIVVSGRGYDYPAYGRAYGEPRDFYKEAEKILKEKNMVKKAMKEGLEKRGIHCD